MRRKPYPLSIQYTGEDADCYYSKGHHDPDVFHKAVCSGEDFKLGMAGEVKHEWWRVVPSHDCEYDSYYHNTEPNRPGAFPVTVTRVR